MKYLVSKENGNWLSRDLDQYFDSIFGISPFFSENQFAVDFVQKEKSYQLTANLPGFSQEEVKIQIDNQMLTIEAKHQEEKKEEKEEEKGINFLLNERTQKSLKRSFKLPEDIDADNITAQINNGTLSLEIPRAGAKKPKWIEVKGA